MTESISPYERARLWLRANGESDLLNPGFTVGGTRLVNLLADYATSGQERLTCGWCQQTITHAEIFTHPCLNKPAVPEPAAQQECQFCGKPENNELHQADADLLKCSSHTRDDYHEFISKSEMRQAEPAPTPSRADELRQLLNVLARGKVRFSRNHGEPNPSPAFPYEAFFSYGDWQWITQLTQKLAEASALGTKEEKSV